MRLDLLEPRPKPDVLPETSTPAASFHPRSLPPIDVPGLSVHVPICFHTCRYCDFYTITPQPPGRMERFVDLILAQADQWTAGHRPSCRPRTVFFGGGPPTLLPIEAMR